MEYGLAWMVLLSLPLLLACGLAEYGAKQYAKGTRERYVWRSIERALHGGVMVFLVASTTFSTMQGAWLDAAIAIVLIVGFVAHWQKIDRDDDDDFWKSLPGRIRNAWSSRRTVKTAEA